MTTASSLKPAETSAIIQSGQSVLAQEIEGLRALDAALGQAFVEAVQCIVSRQGRLIATGMGKSGHIAHKIAATFASTGTPAHFVHPGEASHGDLGMITREDAVLALSNSGETQELADITAHCKRFSVPLIAMVRKASSMLADAATIALVLPEVPEASPIGAPTTSTTMMLALGDALAVAVLQQRGFTRDDFALLHPGGRLGKAFIRVRDLMHGADQLPLVSPHTLMREVLIEMTAKRFGCAGVVNENGLLTGIITDGDLRRHMGEDLLEKDAKNIMTASPATIRPQALAQEALAIMNARGITSLFVCEDGKPVGIIHIHDCLRAGVT